MRGYCKCDLCGCVYHEDENKIYDGITVWWNNSLDTKCYPANGEKIITPDGELTDIPATMDVCPNCFERFYNWIRITRNESKSPKDNDFPMNKPE